MRKRRRLANKMTIMVCAVLCAVSAFFYAPMEVSADEVILGSVDVSALADNDLLLASDIQTSGSVNASTAYYYTGLTFSSYTDLLEGLESDSVYEINYTASPILTFGSSVYVRQFVMNYNGYELIAGDTDSYSSGNKTNHNFNLSGTFYAKGSDLVGDRINVSCTIISKTSLNTTYSFVSNIVINSFNKLSSTDSEDYQNGYNAGYSAGEQAGYGNGYSQGFTDGEASVDNDAIYDEAFQAGKDSVDTQSYYDAGYQAGYDAAYSEGYESGYDSGYQDAMDRIANWGADTSDYPVLEYSFFDDELRLNCDVFTSAPSTSYDSALLCYLDFDVNPNHTYKFVVRTGGTTGGTYDALYSDYKLNFVIGSNVINATNNVGKTFDFFIPGYNMGSSILFEAFVYDCVYYGGVSEEDGFLKHMGQVYPTLTNCYIDVYDMGPSGDTQNHIANQTDQLTNGYDNSQGNAVNSDLSTGLNDYETAENSLFATATTGLNDFTFFDFESVPAMITGMSFIGSIMGSWFNQAGGASGVGIVLSILFSVILVAMVLGLYRWYQSRGGKN